MRAEGHISAPGAGGDSPSGTPRWVFAWHAQSINTLKFAEVYRLEEGHAGHYENGHNRRDGSH
jgi:hypothetical protein